MAFKCHRWFVKVELVFDKRCNESYALEYTKDLLDAAFPPLASDNAPQPEVKTYAVTRI